MLQLSVPSASFSSDNTPYEKIGNNDPVSIADEVPFEIPESWEWVRISDAFQIEMGQSPKGDSVSNLKTGMEFHQGKVFFGEKYISPSDQRTVSPTKIAEPDSILLCVRAPVGKVNITNRTLCITLYAGTIRNIAVFDGSSKVHPGSNVGKIELLNPDMMRCVLEEYVLYYLRSPIGYTELTKHKKATAQESISIDAIRNVLIAVPPINEQIRIVAQIGSAFSTISAL